MNTKYLLITISIVEIIYIYYMIFIFKTRYNFDTAFWRDHCEWRWINILNKMTKNYFKHGCSHSKTPVSFICPFGFDFAKFAIFWFFIRNVISNKYLFINKYFAVCAFIFSLFNINILLRMLPAFYIEYYLHKTYI